MRWHVGWAERFLFAGSSASLLVAVNIYPALWWVSFFVLAPFLYKTVNASTGEAVRLGFLLGLCYSGVSLFGVLPADPVQGAARLILTTIPFVLFAWAVCWCRRRWGYNPLVIAFLWVGFELIFMGMGFKFQLLSREIISQCLLGGIGVLLGAVCVSFLIVLINSLLVMAIHKSMSRKRTAADSFTDGLILWRSISSSMRFDTGVYPTPRSRAPPFPSWV